MPPPSAATTKTVFDAVGGSVVSQSLYDAGSEGSGADAPSVVIAPRSSVGRTSWLSFQKLNAAAHASAITSSRRFHASEANTTTDPKKTVLAAAMNRIATAPR